MGLSILVKIVRPYIIAAIACIGMMGVLRLLDVSWYYVYPSAFAAYGVFAGIFFAVQKKLVARLLTTTHDEIEETLRFSVANNPLPLCLVNGEGGIAMANEKFKAIFPDAKIFKTGIAEIIGAESVEALRAEPDAEARVAAGDAKYSVRAVYVSHDQKSGAMYFFFDVTRYEELKRLYEDEKPVCLYLVIDNYEDILQASPDQTRSMRAAAIENTVREFAKNLEGALLRYRDASYQIVFARKHYRQLEEGKFSILDMARDLENDADFPTSFSIGIGLADLPALAEEYADYALDLARGRGGDQAVVKTADRVTYFGGRVQVIENRSKGKSRVMSHAIRQLVSESAGIMIMGHKHADIDSFGASVALYRMAATHGKEAVIVLSGYNHSLDEVVRLAKESGNYRFMTGEEAFLTISKGTLLIVIDTHTPDMVDYPALLEKADKKILIDHHRKRESMIEGTTLTYMEPNASSTSELVTELLQFDEDIRKLNKFEAELLLGGIFIDTNSFSVKTGSRTFEAAAWLRMNGAETTSVRQFLRNDMEDFRQRASITANAEFTKDGIAISRSDGKHDNAQIIIAQAADELLDIKGIRASFVVGATKKEVVISARSLGDLNVQVIMEKFGGGGHLTMAAAQITGEAIDGTISKLKKFIREAEGETK
ncbi:MAG: DHH family phosphoesterase [Clostridiales Family XIII bacterium]|nr:DHH family phosphoesterase [Clostridiales Family XIII bacterium]